MKARILNVVLICGTIGGMGLMFSGCCCPCAMKSADKSCDVTYIDKEKVQYLMKQENKVILVDVLPAASFAKEHIKGAVSIPLGKLEKVIKQGQVLPKDKTIITYCANAKCPASTKAAKLLVQHGYKNVLDYKDGLAGWKDADLPTDSAQLCKKCGEVKGSPCCCAK